MMCVDPTDPFTYLSSHARQGPCMDCSPTKNQTRTKQTNCANYSNTCSYTVDAASLSPLINTRIEIPVGARDCCSQLQPKPTPIPQFPPQNCFKPQPPPRSPQLHSFSQAPVPIVAHTRIHANAVAVAAERLLARSMDTSSQTSPSKHRPLSPVIRPARPLPLRPRPKPIIKIAPLILAPRRSIFSTEEDAFQSAIGPSTMSVVSKLNLTNGLRLADEKGNVGSVPKRHSSLRDD